MAPSLLEILLVHIPLGIVLIGSLILTITSRWIQIRAIPQIYTLLTNSLSASDHEPGTIPPHRALFTAMTTTIGIGNIVGPLIAIQIGGPGALIGYFLATLFGSAATYTEVALVQKYKHHNSGHIGGPMYYLSTIFNPIYAYIYALFALLLMTMWSATQANALALLFQPYGVTPLFTGIILSLITIAFLVGGIERVSRGAEQMVPFMFFLYSGALLFIVLSHYDQVIPACRLIWNSAFSAQTLAQGATSYGVIHALRWGLAKGYKSNEAGLGTATVPHSYAASAHPSDQGMLAIAGVFSNGILCFLSGFSLLVTGLYTQTAHNPIILMTELFKSHFPVMGIPILVTSTTLFVVSTILGNSYNGSEFFRYITLKFGKDLIYLYYALCVCGIVVGSCFSIRLLWTGEDFLLLPVIVPHIIGIIGLTYRHTDLFTLQPVTPKKGEDRGKN